MPKSGSFDEKGEEPTNSFLIQLEDFLISFNVKPLDWSEASSFTSYEEGFRPLRRHRNSWEQEGITTEQVENDLGLVSTKLVNKDEIPYFYLESALASWDD